MKGSTVECVFMVTMDGAESTDDQVSVSYMIRSSKMSHMAMVRACFGEACRWQRTCVHSGAQHSPSIKGIGFPTLQRSCPERTMPFSGF